jgi:uncharacterized membrane protein
LFTNLDVKGVVVKSGLSISSRPSIAERWLLESRKVTRIIQTTDQPPVRDELDSVAIAVAPRAAPARRPVEVQAMPVRMQRGPLEGVPGSCRSSSGFNRETKKMAKIAATEERRMTVGASLATVYGFFSNPDRMRDLTPDVELYERLSPTRARWVLTEKTEKGIRFGPRYTVEYIGNGSSRVDWRSLDGNMDVEGSVELSQAAGGGTEVLYRETVAPDLPITPILARIFKPIVARELQKDIGRFLVRVQARLDELDPRMS